MRARRQGWLACQWVASRGAAFKAAWSVTRTISDKGSLPVAQALPDRPKLCPASEFLVPYEIIYDLLIFFICIWYHIRFHIHMISYLKCVLWCPIWYHTMKSRIHFIWNISINHIWYHIHMISYMISYTYDVICPEYDFVCDFILWFYMHIHMKNINKSYMILYLSDGYEILCDFTCFLAPARAGSKAVPIRFKCTPVRIKWSCPSSPTSVCPLWLRNQVAVVY